MSEVRGCVIVFENGLVSRLHIHRNRHLGPVLGDEHVFDEPELAARPLEQARQVQFLLVDLQLEAVDVLGDRLQAFPECALVAAEGGQFLVLAGTLGLRRGQFDPGLGDRAVDRVEHGREGIDHEGRGIDLTPADDRTPRSLFSCRTLGLQLTGDGFTPGLLGAHPFLGRLYAETRLDLGLACCLELAVQGVAGADVEDRTGTGACRLELALRLLGSCLSIRHALSGEPERDAESIELRRRRFELHLETVQLLGLRGQLRVELAQRCEGCSRLLLRDLQHAALLGERELRPVDQRRHLTEAFLRCVAIRDQFDAALLRPGTAAQDEIGEHFACARDDRHRRTQLAFRKRSRGDTRCIEVVGDRGEREHTENPTGCLDHGTRGDDAVDPGQVDVGRARVGDDDFDPAEIVSGCVGDRLERCVAVVGEYGIRQRTESRRNRGLIPRAHADVFGHESAHPGEPGVDQCGGAVLLVECERQGAGACGESVALPFQDVEFFAQALDLPFGLEHIGLGELVRLVEVALARVRDGRLRLALGERGPRLLFAVRCRVESVLLPQHLAAHGRQPRCGGIGLPGELGDLEVVPGDEGALCGDLLIHRIEGGPRGARLRLRCSPRGLSLGDHDAQTIDFGPGILDHLGSDAGSRILRLGLRTEQRQALVRHRVEVAEPLLHRFEPEGGASGDIHLVAHLGLLETGDPQLLLLELLLQHDPLAVPFALGTSVRVESRAQGDHVVGEKPGAGIPHDRSDRLGLTRDLRLVPERLELATDLTGQVAEPGQVGLHGVELAQRLLFAPAVLEDPRGLLDEAAAVFRARVEHGVELTLADDHMHLAAQPGVAEQLLHIEEAAGLAVDRILAAAVAEQGARDRDLGVLDRERAVGVVDRQGHFCPAERPAGRRAGEDDVFHLAATEGFRPLLPHHPGQCVDDVGLARSIGADDAGHPGLEGERRRLCERLEPFERQALQIHLPPFR